MQFDNTLKKDKQLCVVKNTKQVNLMNMSEETKYRPCSFRLVNI